jgi:putative transposase
VKYACITRHRGEFKLRLMCRVLEVSPSGYYAWRTRSPCLHAIADERLMLNVRIAFETNGGQYGAPRIHGELHDAGIHVGKKRVARLMRAAGLVGRRLRARSVSTTDSNHAHPVAPNLLDRRFDVNGIALNQVWVSDITYVPTRAGWLYLAVVLDLASRRVVGWAMRDTLETELTVSALTMAIGARGPAPGLIHHSDRGVQYACTEYQAVLAAHGMQPSMSRRGNCWDNAVAESFFATLELELLVHSDWSTHDTARQAIFRYIETWYNPRRRHSTLAYMSPATYEHHRAVA